MPPWLDSTEKWRLIYISWQRTLKVKEPRGWRLVSNHYSTLVTH